VTAAFLLREDGALGQSLQQPVGRARGMRRIARRAEQHDHAADPPGTSREHAGGRHAASKLGVESPARTRADERDAPRLPVVRHRRQEQLVGLARELVVRDGAPRLAAGGRVQARDVGEVIAFECRDHQQVGFHLPERRHEQGKRMGLETIHGP